MIEVRNVGIIYRKRLILDDLSLTVREGELMVLVGASGVGKSTLLRVIAGLERPSSGQIWIDGRDQSRIPPHLRDIAVVFQSGNGYDHLTVGENLKLAASLQKQSSKRTANDIAIAFGIDSLLNQKLSELSGGQSQRVAIARAVLSGKRILLLDEPLAHLDEANRESLRELIRKCHREYGTSTVYITHDSEEALSLSDRIAVMHDGKVVQVGVPQEIYDRPASLYVAKQFGRSPMSFVRLPTHWLDPSSDSTELETTLCGIRSHWWQWSTPKDAIVDDRRLGFSCDSGSTISLVARVIASVWLGDRWQFELEAPSPWTEGPVFVSVSSEQALAFRDPTVVHLRIANDRVHRFRM